MTLFKGQRQNEVEIQPYWIIYVKSGPCTEKKRSHWLKQWPIRKGLGDKKRLVVIGWNFVETSFELPRNVETVSHGKV